MRSAPTMTARTFGKGSAAKQDALRKGKVQASADKLAALIDRQTADHLGRVYEIQVDGSTVAVSPDLTDALAQAAALDASTARTVEVVNPSGDVIYLRPGGVAEAGASRYRKVLTDMATRPVKTKPAAKAAPTPRKPRAAKAAADVASTPPVAADGDTATCTGACARTLPVRKFPTLGGGKRGTECRDCRDARRAAKKAAAS